MIDLRQLQALTAVAAEGSVARAATRLGWSHPTVDYHLKNLDRLVGTELTTRTTRGSTLTAAGYLMLERGKEILALSERALTDVRDLSELGRVRVRFGIFPTAAAHLIPGIARRTAALGIDLDVAVEELSPLVSSVNERTLDAALVYAVEGYELPLRPEIHRTRILTDPILLALPADHPAAHTPSFDLDTFTTLANEHWVIGTSSGDTVDTLLHDVLTQAHDTLSIAIRTDDYSVALGIIAAGLGLGLIPALGAAHPPEGVILRTIHDPRFARELLLTAHGGPDGPPPAVRQLAEAVRRSVNAITHPQPSSLTLSHTPKPHDPGYCH